MSRVSVKAIRELLSLIVAAGGAGGVFYYLSGTPLIWRAAFSLLLFLATYILLDGFLRRF